MQKTSIYKDFLEYIETYVAKPMRIVGFNFMDDDYQLTFLTWAIIFNVFSYLIINGIDLYLVSGDIKSICFCMVTYGNGFIFVGRIINALVIAKQTQKLRHILLSFTFDEDETEELEMYLKYGKMSKFLGALGSLLFLFGGLSAVLTPMVLWAITGNRQLTFGFFIPGVNGETVHGFLVNYSYQCMQIFLTLCALIGYLNTQLILTICACFQIDMVMIKLKKLDMQLLDVNRNGTVLTKQVALRDILQLHQNLNEYLIELETCYSLELFLNVFFYSLTIVVTLFVCVKEFWVIGYLTFMTYSYLLFIPCLYGVAVEIKCDQLVKNIYDIHWYLLSCEDQKMLTLFLHAAQNPKLLTYGGLMPLNLDSFSQVKF